MGVARQAGGEEMGSSLPGGMGKKSPLPGPLCSSARTGLGSRIKGTGDLACSQRVCQASPVRQKEDIPS